MVDARPSVISISYPIGSTRHIHQRIIYGVSFSIRGVLHGWIGCAGPPLHGGGDVAAEAWRLLLTEKEHLAPVPQYRYDLIDFARQVWPMLSFKRKYLAFLGVADIGCS